MAALTNRHPCDLRHAAFAACVLLVLAGCAAYQVGPQTLYRPDINSVFVPIFRSESLRRDLGERLTEAVVRQINQKTPYRIAAADAADSILSGRILSVRKEVLGENAFDEPRELEVDFVVEVSWVDRGGAPLMRSVHLPLSPALTRVAASANFVPEAGQSLATAQLNAIEDLARQIVGQMEVGL